MSSSVVVDPLVASPPVPLEAFETVFECDRSLTEVVGLGLWVLNTLVFRFDLAACPLEFVACLIQLL